MSGLDDSLSDVGGKKKYPFELEKAIHNVMFIQHHMQRQDEFNAVSGKKHRMLSPLQKLRQIASLGYLFVQFFDKSFPINLAWQLLC